MKFSISTATTARVMNELIDAGTIKRTPLREVTGFANFSAEIINGEYVIELNDEVLVKYIGLATKLSKLINNALELMSTDINELSKFIMAKKEG